MPDDPELENMDPLMKMWMFNSWVEDNNENVDLLKHTGYLIGSFIDPKAARDIAENKNFVVDEQVFEDTFKEISEHNKKALEEKPKERKRKRKKIINNT